MCTIILTIYACMRSIEPQKQFTLHLILFCCDFYMIIVKFLCCWINYQNDLHDIKMNKINVLIKHFWFDFGRFFSVLPSSEISPYGWTDWAVMPSTLGAALLCSSRAVSDMWLFSRNSILHRDWGRTIIIIITWIWLFFYWNFIQMLYLSTFISLSLKNALHFLIENKFYKI